MEKMRTYPKVKICGITSKEEAGFLNEANVDYAGFVFCAKSRRNISLRDARRILPCLNDAIAKVAVTVNPTPELIREIEFLKFDLLQVHGEFGEEVRSHVHIPVWRAVNISDPVRLQEFFRREGELENCRVTGYVADGMRCGGGKPFDWANLAQSVRSLTKGKQLILAGGLTEQNVRQGIRQFLPDVVDVSSGVEENGRKIKEKILKFIREVRENGQ